MARPRTWTPPWPRPLPPPSRQTAWEAASATTRPSWCRISPCRATCPPRARWMPSCSTSCPNAKTALRKAITSEPSWGPCILTSRPLFTRSATSRPTRCPNCSPTSCVRSRTSAGSLNRLPLSTSCSWSCAGRSSQQQRITTGCRTGSRRGLRSSSSPMPSGTITCRGKFAAHSTVHWPWLTHVQAETTRSLDHFPDTRAVRCLLHPLHYHNLPELALRTP